MTFPTKNLPIYRFADYKEQVIGLLARVCRVSVETLAALLEAYWRIIGQVPGSDKPGKAVRQRFDADAIRRRRGRVGHDKAKIMLLIQEMNVQEPIEQLLAQLTK